MKDYNQLINFKWGSEPFKRISSGRLTNRWFFYKPITGNLSPAPQTPFSSFCSVPYGGGYPTGYGVYGRCTAAAPKMYGKKNTIIGITHFSASGVGSIGFYYNFFLIKPSPKRTEIVKENYYLGGYDIATKTYDVSAKVAERSVKYSIKSYYPIVIDPSYYDLSIGKLQAKKGECEITQKGNGFYIIVDYKRIKIYWVVNLAHETRGEISDNRIILSGNQVNFSVSYSLDGFDDCPNGLTYDYSLITKQWQKYLNLIDIKADEEVEKLFYTAFYTLLKRPFIYDKNRIFDFVTLWDMYKCHLPLLYLLYPKESICIVEGIKNLFSQENGYFFNSCKMENGIFAQYNGQSACTANLCLSMAKIYGVEYDYNILEELLKKDFDYNFKDFPKKPKLTHNLDMADAVIGYNNAYGRQEYLEKIEKNLPENFDKSGVYLLKKGGEYYEGSNVNYSFRVSGSTEKRLEFTDKKKLIDALDKFFGFTSKPCKFFSKPVLYPPYVTMWGDKLQRFEGLNNEPDMETPYLYGMLGEYDKQNEVLSEIMDHQFHIGNGGLVGNDDSGALSSWYVWNVLGMYPLVGTDRILIGCPKVDSATLHLIKPFKIKVNRENKKSIYLDSIILNGIPLEKYEIKIYDIQQGGELIINLKDKA